jgi:molecular chaperone DnaJ
LAPQREWFEKDYYKVLGVEPSATAKDITRAYRRLAKKYHPDANPGAEERFKEVSAAYDVLGDPQKRKEYDEVRRLGPLGAAFGGAGGGPGPGGGAAGGFGFRVEDLTDLLGGLFDRSGGAPGASTRAAGRSGPVKGADAEAELWLSFEEALSGSVATVHVESPALCRRCGGSCAEPGTKTRPCPTCHGRGTVEANQGFFSLSRPCTTCSGRGVLVDTPCVACGGSGIERRDRQVKVRIPPGVADGQRIKVKGRGDPGRNGGPPGNLFVTVHVAPHSIFGRRGSDLTLTVPVTYPEAALGATITVPTPDGAVSLKIPPGTPTGRTFRVRGRGVPKAGGGRGDLLVTVEVAVPKEVSEKEREVLSTLAKVSDGSPRAHLGV